MANIAFFKNRKLKPAALNEVCGGLQYLKLTENSNVIHYGDVGDKFFIILKGTVSVWIPVPSNEIHKKLKRFESQMRNGSNEVGTEFRFLK